MAPYKHLFCMPLSSRCDYSRNNFIFETLLLWYAIMKTSKRRVIVTNRILCFLYALHNIKCIIWAFAWFWWQQFPSTCWASRIHYFHKWNCQWKEYSRKYNNAGFVRFRLHVSSISLTTLHCRVYSTMNRKWRKLNKWWMINKRKINLKLEMQRKLHWKEPVRTRTYELDLRGHIDGFTYFFILW